MDELVRLVTNLRGGAGIRREKLEGRDYLVAPATILGEAVLAGSAGPILYEQKENAKYASAWNHKPIVVYHPEMNGKPVSACRPEIIETRKVGILLNTKDDGKTRTEAWVEIDKANKVDKRIIENLEKGKMMEVSTGLFMDIKAASGKHKDKDYHSIACNYRPDHLALLPDREGAFSIADGGGLLQTNAKFRPPITGVHYTDPAEALLAVNAGFSVDTILERINGEEERMIFNEALDTPLTTDEILNREFSTKKRDKMDKADFGDPEHEAFPIQDQEDLNNAARLLHHAKDPAKTKERLRAIAKRKDLKVPDSWQQTGTDTSHTNEAQRKAIFFEELRGMWLASLSTDKSQPMPVTNKDGSVTMVANVLSHADVGKGLSQATLDEHAQKGAHWDGYIADVYNDFYIYSQGGKYYKRPYSVDANYNVSPFGKSEEVQHHHEWRSKDGGSFVAHKNKDMSGSRSSTNPQQPDTQTPKGWRHELPSTSSPSRAYNQGVLQMTTEEYVAQAPSDIQEVLNEGLEFRKSEKTRLVTIITANKKNTFPKEQLEKMCLNDLRSLASLAAPEENVQQTRRVNNYGGAATVNHTPPEPKKVPILARPVYNYKKEKETPVIAAK